MAESGIANRDPNHIPGLIAQSSTGVRTDLMIELYADPTTHRLLVDAGTITASSASVGLTGSTAPTSADQIGFSSGGNLVAVSSVNPLPITGSISATNPSVSATAGAVPTSATYIGFNSGGNIVGLSLGQQLAASALPVVLTAIQVTALTPPSNTGYALDASLTTLNTSVNTLLKPASTLTAVTTVSTVTNLSQMNGAVLLMNNGASGTGSQRINLANDNTGIANWGHGTTGATAPTGATLSGLNAQTALPTAVSVGQMAGANGDKFGRQVILPFGQRDIVLPMTQLTLSASTAETSLIAGVASTFLDLISLIVINTSAIATQVDFRDSTGGTIRLSLYIPAGETRGVVFSTPFPQASVNTTWTAKCGTSVSSVIITGSYITNK